MLAMFVGVELSTLADKQAALGKIRQLRRNGVSHDLVNFLLICHRIAVSMHI